MTYELFPKYPNLLVSKFHLGNTEALVITQLGTVCTETSREAMHRLINNSLHILHQHAYSIRYSWAPFYLVVMDLAV
jgi:hypothetical protein